MAWPAMRVGGSLSYYILTISANMVATLSAQHVTTDDDSRIYGGIKEEWIKNYNIIANALMKDKQHQLALSAEIGFFAHNIYDDNEELMPLDQEAEHIEADNHTSGAYD